MKKSLSLVLSLTFILTAASLLTGCNKNKNNSLRVQNQNTTVDKILQNSQDDNSIVIMPIPTTEVTISMGNLPSQQEMAKMLNNTSWPSKEIEVDLSQMSSTMIYSIIFEMVLMPELYDGKKIKVKGNFAVYISEETGDRHYAIIIPDATQCCQQGLEFILPENNKKYPEDFPKIGQEVTLTGYYTQAYLPDTSLITFIVAEDIEE